MIYVSSPYTSPLQGAAKLQAQALRYEKVLDFCVHLAATESLLVFSPIVYGHALALRGNMPTDAGFWHNFNMNVLRRCEAMFNLRLRGWESSKGVKLELEVAKVLGLPVFHFTEEFERMEIN